VINNVDDVPLVSLAVTCDQQRSAVGPEIHSFCSRLTDGLIKRWPRPSVRPSVLHVNSRYEPILNISFFGMLWLLTCYRGWSQIVQFIAYLLALANNYGLCIEISLLLDKPSNTCGSIALVCQR